MSTIQCKRCGKRISQKEEVCPHCGEPVPHDMLDFSLPEFMKKDENKKEKTSNFDMDKHEDPPISQEKEAPKQNKDLTKCKACGELISKNAALCPHCGEPIPKEKKTSMWTWLLILLIIGYIAGEVKQKDTSINNAVQTKTVECKEFTTLHSKSWWDKELGRDSSHYHINIWEKSNRNGKGKVVGYVYPGEELKILAKGKNSYLISSKRHGIVGWISKTQVEMIQFKNPETGAECYP